MIFKMYRNIKASPTIIFGIKISYKIQLLKTQDTTAEFKSIG